MAGVRAVKLDYELNLGIKATPKVTKGKEHVSLKSLWNSVATLVPDCLLSDFNTIEK